MYMKKFYDEADLTRYEAEKKTVNEKTRAKYEALGIADEDVLKIAIQKEVDKAGIMPPKIDYISLADTGTMPKQYFSTWLVTEYLTLGLMEMQDDELFFNLYPETLRYTIKRRPGRYCLHCGEKLGDDQKGELARLHIATKHKGKPSPDNNEPAGYKNVTYFNVTLDPKQHEKYKAVAGATRVYPEKVKAG